MMSKEFSFSFLCDTLQEINKVFNLGDNLTFTLSCKNFRYTYIPNNNRKVVYVPFTVKEVPIKLKLG